MQRAYPARMDKAADLEEAVADLFVLDPRTDPADILLQDTETCTNCTDNGCTKTCRGC